MFAHNVMLDEASAYTFDQLNERSFVSKVFGYLRQTMANRFCDYDWYVLSSHDSNVMPRSAELRSGRKILLFLSDESSTVPSTLGRYYFAIFKSYLPVELPNTNVFPLSLGYVGDIAVVTPPKPILLNLA